MSSGDKSSKTEKPTPKRKREAREQGQIAKTPELAAWGGLLLALSLLESMLVRGRVVLEQMLESMQQQAAEPTQAGAADFFGTSMRSAAVLVAPLLLGLFVFVIVVSVAQVGKPSSKRLKPDFKRLNLAKGIKGLFAKRAWWELAKSLIKTGVLAAIAWPIVAGTITTILHDGAALDNIVGAVTGGATRIIRNVAGAGLVIAAVDYIVQKRRIMKELMMTKQEVREEMRNTEGDPRVKQAIRARQAAMSRNRMINMVSAADVVVVNPTHYAVALKYDGDRGAPEVVAKGAGVIAARIREEAEKHDVTVVRQPVLCRTMYRLCEIGDLIPVELYEAVAQILAFVFALRARGRTGGYHEIATDGDDDVLVGGAVAR